MTRASVAAIALIAVLAAPAARAGSSVEGSIMLATGTPASDGQARPQRCLHALDEGFQGVFGWVLPVDGGATFALTATSTLTDLDIDFFRELGPCQDSPDIATYPNGETYDNQTGNEGGAVPPFATVAVITMRNGPPTATFRYSET